MLNIKILPLKQIKTKKALFALIFFSLMMIFIGLHFTTQHFNHNKQPAIKTIPENTANPSSEIWFDALHDKLTLEKNDGLTLLHYIDSQLQNKSINQRLPSTIKNDKSPRIIFISLSNSQQSANVIMGKGFGIKAAIDDALLKSPKQLASWIKLDIVNKVHQINHLSLTQDVKITPGLQGIAFDQRSNISFLPEEITAKHFLNEYRNIDFRAIPAALPSHFKAAWQQFENTRDNTLYLFSTQSYFKNKNETLSLLRGHRTFSTINKSDLKNALNQASDYLTHSVQANGRFTYIYDPISNTVPNDYNILRHAGTIYAMLQLYAFNHDPELLKQVKPALRYLVNSAKPCPAHESNMLCIVEDGEVKLGGNGLAIVALAKYITVTHDMKYKPIMMKLANWIEHTQAPNGNFTIHKMYYPSGTNTGVNSLYYPGEALLALMRVYAMDHSQHWLDSADKGAKYLITVRDKGLPTNQLPHDHWLLYALNEIYHYRPKSLFMDHALRIAQTMLQSQNKHPTFPDWYGGYYEPPRSTPTATRSEGLIATFNMLKEHGFETLATRILQAIQHGIQFELQTQFKPESVMYFHDPQRALGGFHGGLSMFEIRIDYVQHNVSAIIGLYKLLS